MQPWEVLKVSRASYFRYKRSQPHTSLIPQYVEFRTQGLSEKPWSHNHKKHTLYQLQKYLNVYPLVNYCGVKAWLVGTYSQKKDRHTALSGFCRFLLSEGLMEESEYLKIKKLYPIRSYYDKPKQRLVTSEEIAVITSQSQVCLFLSESGLRISEFADLTPDCLHYSQEPSKAFIEVRCGKGGKARLVPFSRRAQGCQWDFTKNRYWWG